MTSLKRAIVTATAALALLTGASAATATAATPKDSMTFTGYGPTPAAAHNSAMSMAASWGYIWQQCTDFYHLDIHSNLLRDDLYCLR
ncbi:hypothetical protein [Kitasatospora sp. HPMI-4]|uniref:hypothetical protein n=1 Tax=Kitasatospora sp. HPMI-4 TaxID=3448443 RepID=UPI003F198EE9